MKKSPRQTHKYQVAQDLIKQLSSGGSLPHNAAHDEVYAVLDRAGYWWDASSRSWHKREPGQPENGRFRLAAGVYRIRITAHEADIVVVCQKIAAELYVCHSCWHTRRRKLISDSAWKRRAG